VIDTESPEAALQDELKGPSRLMATGSTSLSMGGTRSKGFGKASSQEMKEKVILCLWGTSKALRVERRHGRRGEGDGPPPTTVEKR